MTKPNITVKISSYDDYQKEILTEFQNDNPDFTHKRFSPADIHKLYMDGFGEPALIISAFDEQQKKIGHAVAYTRKSNAGQWEIALLSDLYVSPEHRNIITVGLMYKAMRKKLCKMGIDSIYTVSNEKSERLVKYYLDMEDNTTINFGVGVSYSSLINKKQKHEITSDFFQKNTDKYEKYFNHEIYWNPEILKSRINLKYCKYRLFFKDEQIVASRKIHLWSIPIVVICGIFGNKSNIYMSNGLLEEICSSHKSPVFIYLLDKPTPIPFYKSFSRKVTHKNLEVMHMNILDFDMM